MGKIINGVYGSAYIIVDDKVYEMPEAEVIIWAN